MINFADDWSVQEFARSRQAAYYQEARDYELARSLRGQSSVISTVRHSLGRVLVRLGEYILGPGFEQGQADYLARRSTV